MMKLLSPAKLSDWTIGELYLSSSGIGRAVQGSWASTESGTPDTGADYLSR
ncbi:hypothetical protein [Bacillus sp. mrc49]|uniref:hypothetical protein n=1 Tax=Bacillus sp. mrc49 TaxID=2054913 RepID=UPI0012FE7D68|nr:hypothetical protein [Bacillus sp. mrc49]